MMRDDLRACWDALIEYVVSEYRANQQSVFLNFYHNFQERTLRLRVTGPNPDWMVRTISDEELQLGDLRSIAASAYEESQSD